MSDVGVQRAVDWHRNADSLCETCGAHVPVGTPHRALTVEETRASEVLTAPHNGFGFVIGYGMAEVVP